HTYHFATGSAHYTPPLFITATAPTAIDTLSLHDALPIWDIAHALLAPAQEARTGRDHRGLPRAPCPAQDRTLRHRAGRGDARQPSPVRLRAVRACRGRDGGNRLLLVGGRRRRLYPQDRGEGHRRISTADRPDARHRDRDRPLFHLYRHQIGEGRRTPSPRPLRRRIEKVSTPPGLAHAFGPCRV